MTNSETKKFSQNVSSSYHLKDKGNNAPKLRFKGYNDEWKKVKIGEIYKERSERGNTNAELLSVTMNDGVKRRIDIEGKDISSEDKSNYKSVYIGDMVYNSMRMWQGANGISNYDGIVSPAYTVMFPRIELCNNFIGYLFKYEPLIFLFRRYSQGLTSDTWNLKYPQIKQLSILIPSLPEQEKIASFLTLIDKKIEKQKELVELLKKYKRGLLSQIFSQKLRFKDDNGNDYPEWKEKTLGEVTNNISYGLNAASKAYDGENKYIRITDIDETTGKYNNLDIVSPDCDLSDEYKLKNDDLLFTRTGASTGKTYLYNKNDGKMYFAGFLIKFSIKEEYCSNFVFYITQTFNYKKWVSIMSTRSGQPGINAKEYSKYKFLCPVYDEQIKISNIVLKIDNIIEKETLLLSFYNNYKKGLLQQMFI